MSHALLLLVLPLPAQLHADPLPPLPEVRLRAEPLDAAARPLSTDPVLVWNEALLQAIRAERTAPPKAARSLALLHIALYDAVNSVTRTHRAFVVSARVEGSPSAACAAAIAAHRVLTALHPDQRERFDDLLDRAMLAHPDEDGKEAGVALGQYVAEKVLAWRAGDGTERQLRYEAGYRPGDWQPTFPDYRPPLLPQWGRLAPVALRSADQFRPARPPALTSGQYTAHFLEVKEIGGVTSRLRTRDQTLIAHFWADGEGTVTPPGHWNRIAQGVSQQRGLSLEENARLFALLNLALADAAISCWECKYRFGVWRPVQAIREADRDGNPVTEPDRDWQPLLKTPPFPSYTSGHSTFSGAAAAVLACFFGTDAVRFTTTSEGLPGVTRSFRGFAHAAQEAGKSRIYGGIHYEFDNAEGLAIGRSIGEYVCRTFLRPRS